MLMGMNEFSFDPGIDEEKVHRISDIKKEPEWMREFRLSSFRRFLELELPSYGPVRDFDFDSIVYYASYRKKFKSHDELPEDIKKVYDALGVPEAERDALAGISFQYDSESVYGKVLGYLEDRGVIFTDMDTAVRDYPELVREYIGSVVSNEENKFAALNGAVWSGGIFLYVPDGVNIPFPLQSYFYISLSNMGQFERTLVIAGKRSKFHYIEGCSAPLYSTHNLHVGVVEAIIMNGASPKFTTIQNWSRNVVNIATKRALVMDDAVLEWVDGNIGSKYNVKHPEIRLVGRNAKAELLSISMSSSGQWQDTGGRIIHEAGSTSSRIVSKAICMNGGRSDYRGLVEIRDDAEHSLASVDCETLLLDNLSSSASYPEIKSSRPDAEVSHESRVGRVSSDALLYLMSRGVPEYEAMSLIVKGFVGDIVKEIPFDYAVALNKLMKMKMEGAVG